MASALPATWVLPDGIRDRVGEELGHQRMLASDGHLLLILHEVPEPGSDDRSEVVFWRASSGEWKTCKHGAGLANLKEHFETYAGRLRKLSGQFQAAHRAREFFDLLKGLNPVERALRNGYRTVAEAREGLREARELLPVRDRAEELARTAEILLQDARNGLDFAIAEQAELQARSGNELAQAGHKLNLLAALFLPLTAIASVFGMKLAHPLDPAKVSHFWAVLAAGAITGFALFALFVARRGDGGGDERTKNQERRTKNYSPGIATSTRSKAVQTPLSGSI